MSTSSKEILMFKFEEPLAMCVSLGQSANVVFVYEDGKVENTGYNIFRDEDYQLSGRKRVVILKMEE